MKWAILRMAGPRTLLVVDALNNAGLEAWTPTQMLTRRRPRSKLTVDRRVPIAPTFAFVRGCHLNDLRAALALPINPFPAFSIFQFAGTMPMILDMEICGLRAKEDASAQEWAAEIKRRAASKAKDERDAQRRELPPGARVTAKSEAFLGMTGVIVSSNRKEAWVDLGGNFPIKIDSWLLVEDKVTVPLAA